MIAAMVGWPRQLSLAFGRGDASFRETGTVQVRAEERIFNDVEEENEWRIRTSLLAGARCTGPLPQSLRGRGPFLEPMRRT